MTHLSAKNRHQTQKKRRRSPSNKDRSSSISQSSALSLKPTRPKSKAAPLSQFRLFLVWGVIVAGALGLGWRLYQLQIVQGSELQQKAEKQQTLTQKPYIPRRSIIDAQGNVLATDRLVYTLYVHPIQFKKTKAEIAEKLAGILENKTKQEIIEEFKRRDSGIPLVFNLNEAVALEIKGLGLDGVDLEQKYARFYPQKEMVADAIGYVDRDYQGQAGIEISQQKLLERLSLDFPISRARNGTIIPAYVPENFLRNDELQLQLTLDLRLQRAAREALQQQLKKFKAKRGAVIVMDAQDGSLLALTSEPTYDPNEYYKAKVERFKNWTVADLYEPGSTFKPINIAIALEAGVIQPNDSVYDSGSVTIDGWDIYNASKKGYGSLSIAEVLQTSSNVGMIQIMRRLDKKNYYKRLQDLGLGEKSGIDLPGEVAGHLKSEAVFTERSIEAATTAFGQGFSLTPIKLVQLHAALANGGKLVTPHVVRGLVDPQQQLHWQPDFPVKTLFSPKSTDAVVKMMETVVSEGTGESAQISGYRIGGKTGTAQKASSTGGYLSNAKITSFVAILPVENPRYVVLAVVDEPQGENTFGSTVAAPIVKSVMESLIAIEGIPPSK